MNEKSFILLLNLRKWKFPSTDDSDIFHRRVVEIWSAKWKTNFQAKDIQPFFTHMAFCVLCYCCSASKCNDNKLYCVRHVESCFIFLISSFFFPSIHWTITPEQNRNRTASELLLSWDPFDLYHTKSQRSLEIQSIIFIFFSSFSHFFVCLFKSQSQCSLFLILIFRRHRRRLSTSFLCTLNIKETRERSQFLPYIQPSDVFLIPQWWSMLSIRVTLTRLFSFFLVRFKFSPLKENIFFFDEKRRKVNFLNYS